MKNFSKIVWGLALIVLIVLGIKAIFAVDTLNDSLKDIKADKLTVYYINEKGQKEDYFATIKDGIATFETTHFSTYAIAEKTGGIKNPNTSDNVLIAVATLAISMAGALVAIKSIKK